MKNLPLSDKIKQKWQIIKERLRMMLSLDYSPHKLALACCLGMLVGISPYVGLQTYIAIALAALFRVPVYPLIVGVYITNPITIPFIFTATTKFGIWLTGMDVAINFDWHTVTFKGLWNTGKALLVPFLVGTHVAGILLAIPTYFISYALFKKYKKPKD